MVISVQGKSWKVREFQSEFLVGSDSDVIMISEQGSMKQYQGWIVKGLAKAETMLVIT